MFRKTMLLTGFVLLFYAAKAQQRSCDLEVICISPADTVTNGGSLILRFGAKNLGPDIMFHNEAILYALFRRVDGNITRDYSGAFGGAHKDTVKVGESMIYRDNYTIRFSYPDLEEPLLLDYCVRIASWSLNDKGDTIRFDYYDSNTVNDTCCRQVVVMPTRQTVIRSTGRSTASFNLYPNPARHTLYLRREADGVDELVELSVIDMMGRKLLTWNMQQWRWEKDVLAVDIGQLAAGLYNVQLATQQGIQIKKIIVYE